MEQILNILEDNDNKSINPDATNLEMKDKAFYIDKSESKRLFADIYESIKDYTWEEKFEWVHQKKLKGNRLFNKKKYDDAIQIYLEGLVGLDFECNQERHIRVQTELQIPCLLNMAMCMIEKKEYNKAISLCTFTIELNNTHYRPYYRRAYIYYNIKDFDKAIEDFQTALKLCHEEPAMSQIRDGLSAIYDAHCKKNHVFQPFFDDGSFFSDRPVSAVNDKANLKKENEKILSYDDDLEDLKKFGFLKYVGYSMKVSLKFIKQKALCCKSKKSESQMDSNLTKKINMA